MKYDVIRSYWPAPIYDTAKLNLDFTTGTLDSRLTFTRSGTGTYINSSGYVTTASTNVARFDYDPTTPAPRGLLIEGSAINYMLYSTALDPHTALGMRTISTASITDPEGTDTLARIIAADASTGSHARFRFATAGTNTTVTVSIFAKKNGYKYLYLSDGSNGLGAARFDLDDGSISTTGGTGFVSAKTTAHPEGWWRCSIVVNVTASTNYAWAYVGVPTLGVTFTSYNAAYTGENLDDKGIYCYGFQVEGGAGASSYIPTVASQVTRNADFLLSASSSGSGRTTEFSFDDLAPGTSALDEYTVLWVYGRDPNSKRQYPASLYARTNSNTKRVDLRDFTGTTVEAGTQTRSVQTRNIGTASIAKVALAQNTSAYPSSAVNGTSATLTSGTIDSALGLQWVQLGNSSAVGSSFNAIWARQLKLYPTQLSAAQLQTLTAP
jgi:hypothetical protein